MSKNDKRKANNENRKSNQLHMTFRHAVILYHVRKQATRRNFVSVLKMVWVLRHVRIILLSFSQDNQVVGTAKAEDLPPKNWRQTVAFSHIIYVGFETAKGSMLLTTESCWIKRSLVMPVDYFRKKNSEIIGFDFTVKSL